MERRAELLEAESPFIRAELDAATIGGTFICPDSARPSSVTREVLSFTRATGTAKLEGDSITLDIWQFDPDGIDEIREPPNLQITDSIQYVLRARIANAAGIAGTGILVWRSGANFSDTRTGWTWSISR